MNTFMAGRSSSEAFRHRQSVRARNWALITLVVLLVQNLFGIYVNLYVTLPRPPSGFSELFTTDAGLASHIVTAYVLMGLSIVVVIYAVKTRNRPLVSTSAVGLAAMVLATVMGFAYAFASQDTPILSFSMEAFFATAVGAEVLTLYFAGRVPDSLAGGVVAVRREGGAS